ncbi:fused (3R)-hydroxyacyl-ACP dehydratase subunits HadA/HadB [Rhodococcus sp. P1Y]|uniref:fused (3R)-hydroxyacyl-ACP dehydratase subunits HadA/HadB n=1 Tax=Rhodococcus sp. P1Y TaxID=1302308 RepID=UPI000EAD8143|nr:fused (3R)-hydroxyacyl-ACP dehydratase subunits HadA/HadB [Rhodococcus sp. P1Y]AYJ47986.1 (3R)-hydroxyacyl-ACP dehydratase subunit HadB [Rhodococcus sp. P1Y]
MSENVTASETFDPAEHVRAMVGRHYRAADYYEVGREKVREYARAVQDFNPVHWEGDDAKALGYANVVAPLTFMSLVGTLAQKRLLQKIAVGFDLSQMLQTDQILQYHQPIVAGDHLYCDVSLDSYKEVMGKDMMVTKNIVSNQRNELVQTTYTTLLIGREGDVDKGIVEAAENLVMQGATSLAARAGAADHDEEEQVEHPPLVVVDNQSSASVTFESVAVGDLLPSKTFRLTRGDLVNYAGVAGDANPIHWSEQFAKLIDLDNVLAHGMLTMGLGGGYVTEWLGDPGAVKDYTVRFTAPIPVDGHRAAEIKFDGKIKSLDAETRTAVVALNATFEGKRIFGHRATATVQLA